MLVEEQLLAARGSDEETQKAAVTDAWTRMNYSQRLVYNKLISGAFRVGVSQLLVVRALSQFSELPTDVIAHRLMGEWTPSPEFFKNCSSPELESDETPIARPYPFHLAHQIDFAPQDLGKISDWQAEWKWDGIRAQVIKRQDEVFIWSRGEDLMTERFPEIADAAVRAAERHGPRRRDPAVARRPRAAVYRNAATHRPQESLGQRSCPRCRSSCSATTCSNTKARDIRSFRISNAARVFGEGAQRVLTTSAKQLFRPTESVEAANWEHSRNIAKKAASSASRALCSSIAVRHIASAGIAATGGNGRSIRSPSMPS